MNLITPDARKVLELQWPDQSGSLSPKVKLFTPSGAATWLIHSIDQRDPDILFGLCDLGMGFPELGYVSLKELQDLQVPVKIVINGKEHRYKLSVERDLHFRATHPLTTYAAAADRIGRITENPSHLDEANIRTPAFR